MLVYYVMLFQIFLLFSVLYANLVLLVLFVSMFSSLLKNPPLLKKRKLLNLNILSLNNMNILITGGTSGIGLAAAKLFLRGDSGYTGNSRVDSGGASGDG